ncbi:MAG: glucose-6-phosphate dehydrogenase assembly protein OpcA [Planctomycetota bacterium]|jgi:glucose-6-phosphate dehydrogenase assembly protein OpcA
MTTTVAEHLGIEVPIGTIEGELKKLWEADEASTNASLMNLAVYSEDPESLACNSLVIQALTRQHACRAILIGMDRRAAEIGIHAWITAHCHMAHGKKSVCCEQLSFLLEGKAVGRLRNTVFAHLASDLPLVFWWQGELSDLFEPKLYRMIDQLVVDSSDWEDPVRGFGHLREATEDARHRIVVQDLAWTRSYHYRLAVAGLFDDLVAQRSLPQVSEVHLVAQGSCRTTALLFLAWLGTQAGWKLKQEQEQAAGCRGCIAMESRTGQAITVSIDWDDEAAPLGMLEMRGPGFLVSVSRERDSSHLQQRLECPGHELILSGPADGDRREDLVADLLARGVRDELFRKVWPLFFELLELA